MWKWNFHKNTAYRLYINTCIISFGSLGSLNMWLILIFILNQIIFYILHKHTKVPLCELQFAGLWTRIFCHEKTCTHHHRKYFYNLIREVFKLNTSIFFFQHNKLNYLKACVRSNITHDVNRLKRGYINHNDHSMQYLQHLVARYKQINRRNAAETKKKKKIFSTESSVEAYIQVHRESRGSKLMLHYIK